MGNSGFADAFETFSVEGGGDRICGDTQARSDFFGGICMSHYQDAL